MTEYLLGTDALTALLSGNPQFVAWSAAQGSSPLHVSTMSVARLLAAAEASQDVANRRTWIHVLTIDVPIDFATRLHGFDLRAAKCWSVLRSSLAPGTTLVETELSVIAVAMAEDLHYVGARLPWHASLPSFPQTDPWTGLTYPP